VPGTSSECSFECPDDPILERVSTMEPLDPWQPFVTGSTQGFSFAIVEKFNCTTNNNPKSIRDYAYL
jgi:hypothetical protein